MYKKKGFSKGKRNKGPSQEKSVPAKSRKGKAAIVTDANYKEELIAMKVKNIKKERKRKSKEEVTQKGPIADILNALELKENSSTTLDNVPATEINGHQKPFPKTKRGK